jgi:SAM-dependent MidA family methyltransferase
LAPRSTDDVASDAEFGSVAELLAARIRRHGPLAFDDVVEAALYHPRLGFYSRGGSAGRRRGDFITSPEVGPLFGAVVGRALDEWWRALGEPDPFTVVDVGAGAGTLAKSVAFAAPDCLPALTYVLVEQSDALRRHHAEHLPLSVPQMAFGPRTNADETDEPASVAGTGPRFVSLASMPALSIVGVVVANELLDNLPFRLLERAAGSWLELRVGLGSDDRTLVDVRVPAADELASLAERFVGSAPEGARLPLETGATDWLRGALGHVDRGRVVVVDYTSTTPELAARPMDDWLRTYREHERGGAVLDDLGWQDVTVDVCVDQLSRVRPPTTERSQVAFLDAHGLPELVEQGRRIWQQRGHVGDLDAVRGRSRVSEAEALTDPDGLGSFRVIEWEVG